MAAFDAARLAGIEPWLARRLASGVAAGAVTLLAGEDEVHVFAAGVQDVSASMPMRADTIFRMLSMTKPMVAAAAVMLVEDGAIALDDAVERWLPELAARRVLRHPGASLDDTVSAARPVTLRDLLTFRLGLGVIFAPPGTSHLAAAMAEAGVAPGPDPMPFGPDEYMRRIGALPLAAQPGECWMYHTGIDVLAVLLVRLTGKPLDGLLEERIFAPLGMADTGFFVPEEKIHRFATGYRLGEAGLEVHDPARDGAYARAPLFPNAIVSTARDYLEFCQMLLAGGRTPDGRRLLSRAGVALMMTDQITLEQKARSFFTEGFWERTGWGFGGGIVIRRDDIGANPGTYGWSGGFGTAFIADPGERLIALCLTQRLMRAPDDMALARDFFNMGYAALN